MTLVMKSTPLSSNVNQIGYDDETQELVVQFAKGGQYIYSGVPADIADGVINAPSVGQALNLDIKGFYPYRRG